MYVCITSKVKFSFNCILHKFIFRSINRLFIFGDILQFKVIVGQCYESSYVVSFLLIKFQVIFYLSSFHVENESRQLVSKNLLIILILAVRN